MCAPPNYSTPSFMSGMPDNNTLMTARLLTLQPYALALNPTSRAARTSSLSFRPSFTSGMPDRNTFMTIFPLTSQRSTVPLFDISMFTWQQRRRSSMSLMHQQIRCTAWMPS